MFALEVEFSYNASPWKFFSKFLPLAVHKIFPFSHFLHVHSTCVLVALGFGRIARFCHSGILFHDLPLHVHNASGKNPVRKLWKISRDIADTWDVTIPAAEVNNAPEVLVARSFSVNANGICIFLGMPVCASEKRRIQVWPATFIESDIRAATIFKSSDGACTFIDVAYKASEKDRHGAASPDPPRRSMHLVYAFSLFPSFDDWWNDWSLLEKRLYTRSDRFSDREPA